MLVLVVEVVVVDRDRRGRAGGGARGSLAGGGSSLSGAGGLAAGRARSRGSRRSRSRGSRGSRGSSGGLLSVGVTISTNSDELSVVVVSSDNNRLRVSVTVVESTLLVTTGSRTRENLEVLQLNGTTEVDTQLLVERSEGAREVVRLIGASTIVVERGNAVVGTAETNVLELNETSLVAIVVAFDELASGGGGASHEHGNSCNGDHCNSKVRTGKKERNVCGELSSKSQKNVRSTRADQSASVILCCFICEGLSA